jgi:hypothetical protein
MVNEEEKSSPSFYAAAAPKVRDNPYPAPTTVDAEGHFKVVGLLPGIKYTLHSLPPKAPEQISNPVAGLGSVSLEAGKTTADLGDLKINVP